MVTSGLDGWSPPHLGVQNSAYRFTCPKIFSQTSYLLKDKTEAETLIKGLSKAKARDKMKS